MARLRQSPTCAKSASGRARTRARRSDANRGLPIQLSRRTRHCGEACVSATHGSRKLPGCGEGSRAFLEKGALDWGVFAGGGGFRGEKERLS